MAQRGELKSLHTGADLLTYKQAKRLDDIFTSNAQIDVEVTWGIYQRITEAYRDPDKARGTRALIAVIQSLSQGVPAALVEIATFGQTLKERAADMLIYFDRLDTSN